MKKSVDAVPFRVFGAWVAVLALMFVLGSTAGQAQTDCRMSDL